MLFPGFWARLCIVILWLWVFIAFTLYSVLYLPLARGIYCGFTAFCLCHAVSYVHHCLDVFVACLVYAVYCCIGVLVALVWLMCGRGTVMCRMSMLCLDVFVVYMRYLVLSTPLSRCVCVCVTFLLDSVPYMCRHCFVVHALCIFHICICGWLLLWPGSVTACRLYFALCEPLSEGICWLYSVPC